MDQMDLERPQARQASPRFETISADSHITEPPDCYATRIDPKYRDRAPYVEKDTRPGRKGDVFVIPDMPLISMGLVAAAGRDPRSLQHDGSFDSLHEGGWNPRARLADQDRDGVLAELIYPTVGMVIASHPDVGYVDACAKAYNDWLQEYCSAAPNRLFGLGMTAVLSVEQAVKDLERMKAQGFEGALLPSGPGTEFDYDDVRFDPLWRAAVELDLPVSFHILTGANGPKGKGSSTLGMTASRGPKIAAWNQIIRACQDVISLFIFGRVFERHPQLKLVCVEADAGWAPHFMYRMDHVYKRHRTWMGFDEMSKMPSEVFRENVYLTFQDDWVAFRMTELCNPRRLMWANDFPHSDATWPWSQEMLAEHTQHLTPDETRWILHDNVKTLYDLKLN